jgi:hypothetical protein
VCPFERHGGRGGRKDGKWGNGVFENWFKHPVMRCLSPWELIDASWVVGMGELEMCDGVEVQCADWRERPKL